MTEGRYQGCGGLVLGLGCVRGTPAAEMMTLGRLALSDAGFPNLPLLAIASLDSRATEPAILAVADHFAVPLLTFAAARLEAETPRIATPSPQVFRLTGCHGVAEAAALAAAGAGAGLLVPKRRSALATAAVAFVRAESDQQLGAGGSHIGSACSQIESTPRVPELAE